MTPAPTTWPARIAAIVAPALVLLGASYVLSLPELEERGVVNGRPRPGGAVAFMDRELRTREPEVLVLGNSYAWTNLDHEALASAVALPPRDVLVLSVPNSIASHWYATLEHRVYDAGLEVPLVIVVSSMASLLQTEPYTETSRDDLLAQLAPREEVLDRFVRRRSPLLESFRRRKAWIRDDFFDRVRDRSITAVLDVDPEAEMERVFHHARLDDEGAGGPPGRDGPEDALQGDVDPQRTLVPELMRLASDHGTRLLFLRTPDAPRTAEQRRDPVDDGKVAELAALVTGAGHSWLDLYALELPGRAFANARHMTPEGAVEFTKLAGPAIRQVWDEATERPAPPRR